MTRLKEALTQLSIQSVAYYHEQRGDRGVAAIPNPSETGETLKLHKRSASLQAVIAKIYEHLDRRAGSSQNVMSTQQGCRVGKTSTKTRGLLMTQLNQYTDSPLVVDDEHAFHLFSSQETFAFAFAFDFDLNPRTGGKVVKDPWS
ncbi:hypothetical protein LTR17_027906, partial [Elasticomyces elasticus]